MSGVRVGQTTVYNGDCLDVMDTLAMLGTRVDSIVTDPPYGLQFMGKEWDKLWRNKTDADQQYVKENAGTLTSRARKLPDYAATDQRQMQTWHEEWAKRAFALLKPGGYLLAFSGSRTYHRMAVAIEDAGFEIRDMLQWIYGVGFPKSHDVSKAIDKAAGAERVTVGTEKVRDIRNGHGRGVGDGIHAAMRDGPVYMERNITAPATDAAREWDGWGTALKPAHEPIVMARKPLIGTVAANVLAHGTGAINIDACRVPIAGDDRREMTGRSGSSPSAIWGNAPHDGNVTPAAGRFPANVLHDGSDEVLEAFGEAARFFYCAKASRKDRAGSKHPTVKPVSLIEYLCRMVTRPGGVVLDPFAGSGTLADAWPDAILIEREQEYFIDIMGRLARREGKADAV